MGASVVGPFFQLLAVSLFTYYFAVDGPRLRRWLCTFLPPHRQRELLRLADIAVDRTAAYFYYRMALAALSTAVHTLVFMAIGLPNALALGLWVGVISQFVPTVGTYIAGDLPILVAITNGLRPALTSSSTRPTSSRARTGPNPLRRPLARADNVDRRSW